MQKNRRITSLYFVPDLPAKELELVTGKLLWVCLYALYEAIVVWCMHTHTVEFILHR